MWRPGKIARFTFAIIFTLIVCDWYLFPNLFSNVVHSRYFSLRCKSPNESACKELDQLFFTRNENCNKKANKYWMTQPTKTNTKSVVYDGLNQYWSNKMIDFLDHNNQDTLNLLVMIISVQRRNGSYLQHITRILHQQIQKMNHKRGKTSANLVICNSDADLEGHKEATYLSHFIDVISINQTNRSHKCCKKENW